MRRAGLRSTDRNDAATHSVPGILPVYIALAHRALGVWTAEHDLAGGAELSFVFDQALRHAVGIRDCLLTKPERIRRADIGFFLRVGDGRKRSHVHDDAPSGSG